MPARSAPFDAREPSACGRSDVRPGRSAQARRRLFLALAVLVIGAGGFSLVGPMVHHAVRDIGLPLHHADIIRQQARDKHLDPALIAAVIDTESKFNDDAGSSSAGAIGLMQLEPGTARFIATRSGATRFSTADLATPQVNIAYGSFYLRYLLDRYGGSTVLAVAAYNGGEANVDRWLVQASRRGHDFGVEEIPFPETRAYVSKVLRLRGDYRATYSSALRL